MFDCLPPRLLRSSCVLRKLLAPTALVRVLATILVVSTLVMSGLVSLGLVGSLAEPAAAVSSGTLGFAQIEGFWVAAGGPSSVAATAAAITGAESGFQPGAIQQGTAYCGSGSNKTGWGLWQITCGNSESQFGQDYQMLDPWNNAEAAVAKYEGSGGTFNPWTTYTRGTYLSFLPSNPPAPVEECDPGQYVPIGSAPSGTNNTSQPGTTFGVDPTCGASVPATNAARDLLTNGGFTDFAAGWSVVGSTNYVVYGAGQVPGENPYAGAGFAAFNSTNNGGIMQDVPITINTGDTYCVSAEVSTQGTASGATGTLGLFMLGGVGPESAGKTYGPLPGSNVWTPIQTCITATVPHTELQVQFYASSGTTTADVVEIG